MPAPGFASRIHGGGERLGLGLALGWDPDVGDHGAEADADALFVGAEELVLVVADEPA